MTQFFIIGFLAGLSARWIYRAWFWLIIPTYYEPLDPGGACAYCRGRKGSHIGPKRRCIRFAWEG